MHKSMSIPLRAAGAICSTTALCLGLGTAVLAGEEMKRDGIASSQTGAPSFVLADPATEEAAIEAPENPMLDAIHAEFRQKYEGDNAVDATRLQELVDGSYLSSYDQGDLGGPVQFSNTVFNAQPGQQSPAAQATPDPAPPQASAADNLSRFLSSPAGLQAIARMNDEQIDAIAMMMEIMRDPTGMQPHAMPELDGIPALGADALRSMSPEELVHMAMESAPKPREVNVGNGEDMYLSSWTAGQDAEGNFYLVNANLPGSQIGVAPGDIVGEFGRVTDVRIDATRGPLVAFETGDIIAERNPHQISDGIPALSEDLVPGDDLSGEIIVSEAAPGAPGATATAQAEKEKSKDLGKTRK
ncbi:hypothetical protein ACEUZ9_004698 [Paracoccus litorisediminis]|uniref:hypothetical protein n=1 Tax=Paracoccus litorisediminis TaxID=2006130 RepID=UPI0037310155